MRSHTKDLTKGSPFRLILSFSIPIFFGCLFQQVYSLVDTLIVSRVLGKTALAAIGSTFSISFLICGFVMGMCSGFSIMIANRFGAKDETGLRKCVANSVWLGIIFCTVVTAVITFLCHRLLVAMGTPADIIDQAYDYIIVIFAGLPAVYLYNMTSGIIRAMGDSRTPVIFLLISSVLNIFGDLYFVVVLGTGIAGAAWSTVISQTVSGVLCLLFMRRKLDILRFRPGEMKPDAHIMGKLCYIGIPMGLQYSVTAIGSVIMQTSVNALGSEIVAAMTTSSKVCCFFCCPFDALGTAMATYGGQNVGAKKIERLDRGLKASLMIGFIYSVAGLMLLYLFGGDLAALFVSRSETELISNAHLCMVGSGLFFAALTMVDVYRFLIQGMGYSSLAILSGVFEMVSRIISAFYLVPVFKIYGVALASPLAWVFADAFLIPTYHFVKKDLMKKMNISEPCSEK